MDFLRLAPSTHLPRQVLPVSVRLPATFVQFSFSLLFSEREVNWGSCSLYVIGRPSVVCLSVALVHPTQAIVIFSNISTPCGTLAIHDLCIKILRRSSLGNPSVGGVKHKRDSRIQRFWTYPTLYLGNGARQVMLVLITNRKSHMGFRLVPTR